jgi:hypothetical protein
MEGTTDGKHNCRVPFILGGPFGPGAGALWQCDCGDQWKVVTDQDDRTPPRTMKRWERVQVELTRADVLSRVLTVLPAHIGTDERGQWYVEHTLAALERLHLEQWAAGGKVAKREPAS